MASNVGQMVIDLQANFASLQSDLGRAAAINSRAADQMAAKWGGVADKIGGLVGAGAIAGAAALTALAKNAIDTADQIYNASTKIGVTTKELSALKYQAGLADVEFGALQAGLVKFSKALAEAGNGGKEQAALFRDMGIEIRTASGVLKPTQSLLEEVADRFQLMANGADKVNLATKLAGKSGAEFINFLSDGSRGMREAAEEARAFGLEVTEAGGRAADQFSDNLDRLKGAAQGLGNQIAERLTPAMAGFTGQLVEASKQGEAFAEVADTIADTIREFSQFVVTSKGELDAVGQAGSAAIDTLSGSAEIAAGVLTNLGHATFGILRAASGDLTAARQEFDLAGTALTAQWEAGADRIRSAWTSASDGIDDSMTRTRTLFESLKTVAAEFRNVQSGATSDAPIVSDDWDPALMAWPGHGSNTRRPAGSSSTTPSSGRAAGRDNAQRDAAQAAEDHAKAVADLAAALSQQRAEMSSADAVLEAYKQRVTEANEQVNAWAATGVTGAEVMAYLRGEIDAATLTMERQTAELATQGDVLGAYLAEVSDASQLVTMTARQRAVADATRKVTDEWRRASAAGAVMKNSLEDVAAGAARAAGDLFDLQEIGSIDDLLADLAQGSVVDGVVNQIKRIEDAMRAACDPKTIAQLEDALGNLQLQKIGAQMERNAAAVAAGLGRLQSMAEEGSRSYEAMGVAIQATNVVAAIGAIVNQGNGDPYTAFARMAAMAAAVAQLVDGIGSFAGGGFSDTAAQRQAVQGTGSVLGDAEAKSESIANAVQITADATSQLPGLGRAQLNALNALQNALGGAAGLLARGAGDAEFGNLAVAQRLPLGMPDFLGDPLGILGGKSKITDQGIIIFGGALAELLENIAVGAYQEVESRSWAFGSTHTNTGITDITDQFGQQFTLIMTSIADTVREGALALGLVPAEVEAAMAAYRVEEIRISLKDLSAEEQQAELAAVFSEIFDGLAGAVVPFVEQFQRVGEGLGETLVRVATGVQVTQEAMRYLGIAIDETDPEKFAQISESLIDMVGGIDAMIAGMQSFVSNFATDAHMLQVATSELNDAFGEAGLKLPATADGMWALMQTFDATTEEGREQIATLLRLSDTARQYYDLLEKAEESRLEYAMKAAELRSELGIGSEFITARAEIEAWTSDTIDALNDLARAAGRAGAAESDLVNVHRVAAQRVAQLIAQLREKVNDLAVQLGYITQGDTLESLNAQIASMGAASSDAAGAIGDAVDSMREKMNLLLGDLSPFNDQKKLELALQGLREGSVDPQQVLEIGRRLYASTSNYTNLFDQVMSMARFGSTDNDVGSDPSASEDGRTLAQLIAERDEMLAAQRPQIADELARRIAELSYASGDEFAEIAEGMGWTLDRLAEDLGYSDDQLGKYLSQLRDQFEAQDFGNVGAMIKDAIDLSRDAIVAAIQGKPVEDIIAAADQRMADQESKRSAEREATNERLERIETAVHGLTSAVVSSDRQSDALIGGELSAMGREMREERMLARSNGRLREVVR